MFSRLRQLINIKYFMVAYLSLLLLSASIVSNSPWRALFGLAIVAIYVATDLLWTWVRDHSLYAPISSIISGLVLANVGLIDPSFTVLIAMPLIAVAGKQLIHLGKMRHIFNPAGLSLLITTLFTPVISWWAASTNSWILITVALVGSFILWKQKRWPVALAFLCSYAFCQAGILLMRGTEIQALPTILVQTIWNGSVIFFSTVMLIEPITSTFPQRSQSTIYGAMVGVFASLALLVITHLPIVDLDPLIVGLLAGNLLASLLFLPKRQLNT